MDLADQYTKISIRFPSTGFASNHHIWKWKVKVKSLSCVRLFATPWTVAHQPPPSMEISRQEYWSGLPFPSPGDVPNPGIEPMSPTLQADTLAPEPPGKPSSVHMRESFIFSTYESLVRYIYLQNTSPIPWLVFSLSSCLFPFLLILTQRSLLTAWERLLPTSMPQMEFDILVLTFQAMIQNLQTGLQTGAQHTTLPTV